MVEQRQMTPLEVRKEFRNDGARVHYTVPKNLYPLNGHFTSMPIVPGVCQIGWVVDLINQLSPKPIRIKELASLKFHKFLEPETAFYIDVSKNKGKWKYEIANDADMFASGKILLR